MAEWHLSPEYILGNWTEEQLELYIQCRNERVARANGEEPEERIDYEKVGKERYEAFQRAQQRRVNG